MSEILILYYSRNGSVEHLANMIARGVAEAGGIARLRTVPSVSPNHQATEPAVPTSWGTVCQQTRLSRMLRTYTWQPYTIWQYGSANEIFLGHYRR